MRPTTRKALKLQMKREAIVGKNLVGVDPGKGSHTAVVLDSHGHQQGTSFSFPVSRHGFDTVLWKKLAKRLDSCSPHEMVVAVETSCNLWVTVAHRFAQQGYVVLLVSPLTTYHARPMLDHDFSKTDPKDAFLIADSAQKGLHDLYEVFSPDIEALHELSIAYDKVWKDRAKAKQRLRSFMEKWFPEYLSAFDIDTKSSLHLLESYFLPRHFRELDVVEQTPMLEKVSYRKHGAATLWKLYDWAKISIGVHARPEQESALRIILDGWIAALRYAQQQLAHIEKAMVALARSFPAFHILKSIPNINENLAAQFVAECRDLSRFTHFKQIEKLAGLNLRLSDSGHYTGARHISHIGNNRLRRIIYQMVQQTAKVVPQVRLRFLKRQLKRKCYRKNIIAASSQLLQLILALVKQNRPYEERTDCQEELARLEEAYDKTKKPRKARTPAPWKTAQAA